MTPEGTRIGPYVLQEELGRGGAAVVYRARDTQLQRDVAIKILRDPPGDAGRLRFLREAQAAARVNHPNLVSVHDAGEFEGCPYLVMELVQGHPLDPRRPAREVAATLQKTAAALEAVHRRGIIHRDLKPGNILIDEHREPRIVDFGLARLADAPLRLTRTGSTVGTPLYMAPEQVSGREPVGPPTDVYALGAILYETLAGHPPHVGRTPADVFEKIIHEDPPAPPGPGDLVTICMKAIDRDAARRYASAGAFAEDLRRWLDGEPISARPPSTLYRLRRSLRRHRGWLLGALTSALVVAASAWGISSLGRDRAFRESAQEARKAHAAGDWTKALVESERAMRLRSDPGLEKLAGDCRARIAAEEADKQRRIAEGEGYRRAQERIRPVEAIIRETRPFFYVAHIDIREKLARVEQALEELERAARDPECARRAEVWGALGMGWYFAGDARRAEEALLRALALAPEDGWANFYLGRICLERSLDMHLRTGTGGAAAGRAAEHLGRPVNPGAGAEEIDRHLVEAYQAVAEKDGERAEQLCEEGLARFGDAIGTEEYWMLRAVIGRTDPVQACGRALARRPHYPWARFVRGYALHLQGDLQGALRDYDEVLRVNPRFEGAWHSRGMVRFALGDAPGALADHTECLRLEPDNAVARRNRGATRESIGDLDGAIEDYDAAIRIDANFAGAYVYRGSAWRKKKDLEKALADIERGIALAPDQAEGYFKRALVREDKGDLDGARADYDAAIRLRPGFPMAWCNRGKIKALKDDWAGALPDLDEAVRLDPRCVEAYMHRGVVHGRAGRIDDGIADLERALELAPAGWPFREQVQRMLERAKGLRDKR